MPLLEKAYAKFDQNYERIIAGSGAEGLRSLTAMPTKSYMMNGQYDAFKTVDKLWEFMVKTTNRDFPQTAGTRKSKDNIVNYHAYTVLQAQEIKDTKGNRVARLLKIRNPWSKEKYTGPWSDSSTKWTKYYMDQVGGLTKADDGKFWIAIEEFKDIFSQTSVAFYDGYAGYTAMDVDFSGKSKYYTLTNPVDQEVYVVLDTYSPRNYPRATKCAPDNKFGVFLYQGSTLLERGST